MSRRLDGEQPFPGAFQPSSADQAAAGFTLIDELAVLRMLDELVGV